MSRETVKGNIGVQRSKEINYLRFDLFLYSRRFATSASRRAWKFASEQNSRAASWVRFLHTSVHLALTRVRNYWVVPAIAPAFSRHI